jgi:hypothetical protein
MRRKTTQCADAEYTIGVHNDDSDCYDIVIKQNGRPVATLIAPESDVAPLVHAGNCYPTVASALGLAANVIEEASDILHYEDGEAVTFLESREIEIAYIALVSVMVEIEQAIALCALKKNTACKVAGA